MIWGNDKIITWFQATGFPYWMAYHKASGIESGQYAMRSNDAETATNNTALEDLKKFMALCIDGSEYILVSSPTPKLTSKGYMKEVIEIRKNGEPAAGVAGTPMISGLSETEVDKRVKAALDQYKAEKDREEMKKRMVELEKENKELKRSIDEPINKIIGAISPYGDQIVSGIFGPRPQVAGIQPNTPMDDNAEEMTAEKGEDLNPEQSAVLQEFVTALSTHDPDWLGTLQRMTRKIQANPGVVAMFKTFL